MANGTLQDLFAKSKNRPTDRVAFVQAVSRLSCAKSRKDEDQHKPAKAARKAA